MIRIFLLAIVAAGCTQTAEEYGRALFADASLSTAGSNRFSCATCHERGRAREKLLPGYSLGGAVERPSYWGGFEGRLLDAINQCVTQFMRGRALTADETEARALHIYLATLDGERGAQPLTVVRDIVDVPSGDAAHGRELYAHGCQECHGAPKTGQGRISAQASILPDDTLKSFGADDARLVTVEKLRHGKFYGVGGNMPLYSLEALSDGDLGDVLAYLETAGLPPSPTVNK